MRTQVNNETHAIDLKPIRTTSRLSSSYNYRVWMKPCNPEVRNETRLRTFWTNCIWTMLIVDTCLASIAAAVFKWGHSFRMLILVGTHLHSDTVECGQSCSFSEPIYAVIPNARRFPSASNRVISSHKLISQRRYPSSGEISIMGATVVTVL